MLTCLIGCGPSEDVARGEAAVKRLQARKTPGFVRVVNLTGALLPVMDRGRSVVSSIPPAESSRLVPLGVGKQTLQLGSGTKVEVDLESGVGTTVVIYPGNQTELFPGDFRRPDAAGNVRVVFGKDANFNPRLTGAKTLTLERSDKTLELPPGDYQCGDQLVTIEPNCAYTFLFVNHEARPHTFLLTNTPREKPGASATGTN